MKPTPTTWWTDDTATIHIGAPGREVAITTTGAITITLDGAEHDLGTLSAIDTARLSGWLLGTARTRGPTAALDALYGAGLVPPCPKCQEAQPCRCTRNPRPEKKS